MLHPDLGLGGAERLIVDASKALQDSGHNVTIYTGYHDPRRCFRETCDNSLRVNVIGKRIPRAICGKFHALLAYIKMIYIAFYIVLFSQVDYHLVLCDQVAACIPVFKLVQIFKPYIRIVFYCHFPDQLLTGRESFIKNLYRKPIDFFEEWSTSLADKIVVNSNFTGTVVRQTFTSFRNRQLYVLHPCVSVETLSSSKPSLADCGNHVKECIKRIANVEKSFTFLSLNRFERKKDLELAIQAMQVLQLKLDNIAGESDKVKDPKQVFLLMAGGYDKRLSDSVEYYNELVNMVADDEALRDQVMFIKSPDENEKLILLRHCGAVIYTPKDEHFGIVPLEAMALSKPVIASRSGGPLETVETEGQYASGKLCDHDSESFADAMLQLCQDRKLSDKLGRNGLKRVQKLFSYESFQERLNKICFEAT